jgi:hypothetical protein
MSSKVTKIYQICQVIALGDGSNARKLGGVRTDELEIAWHKWQDVTSLMGPATAEEALVWAKLALDARRYWPIDHTFHDRQPQRRISKDMKYVIRNATSCESHPEGRVTEGGTCWRITGLDLDEVETSIGVEISRDHLGCRVVIVTVF